MNPRRTSMQYRVVPVLLFVLLLTPAARASCERFHASVLAADQKLISWRAYTAQKRDDLADVQWAAARSFFTAAKAETCDNRSPSDRARLKRFALLFGDDAQLAPAPVVRSNGTGGAPHKARAEAGADSDSAAVHTARPKYPEEARENHWTGTVEVKVDLDAASRVVRASVYKSSGHDALDNAALDAARASSYQTRRVHGVSVADSALVIFDFNPGEPPE